jgi:hypothetical protein
MHPESRAAAIKKINMLIDLPVALLFPVELPVMLLHHFGFRYRQVLADIFGPRPFPLSPVAIPVRAMRASLAVLAAGDSLQAVGGRSSGAYFQHLPVAWQLVGLRRLAHLCDEVLYVLFYLTEHRDVLARQ